MRRAILPETAATLTDIMEQVVLDGTGEGARGWCSYTVAGKTGTADKLVNGRYSPLSTERVVRRLRAVAQSRC